MVHKMKLRQKYDPKKISHSDFSMLMRDQLKNFSEKDKEKSQIHLYDIDFNDDQIDKLFGIVEMSRIDSITITRCRLSTHQCRKIADKLKDYQGLSFLDLSKNHLGDENIIIIAEMLKNNFVHEVILDGNNITDIGAIHIRKACESNINICFNGPNLANLTFDNNISKNQISEIEKILHKNQTRNIEATRRNVERKIRGQFIDHYSSEAEFFMRLHQRKESVARYDAIMETRVKNPTEYVYRNMMENFKTMAGDCNEYMNVIHSGEKNPDRYQDRFFELFKLLYENYEAIDIIMRHEHLYKLQELNEEEIQEFDDLQHGRIVKTDIREVFVKICEDMMYYIYQEKIEEGILSLEALKDDLKLLKKELYQGRNINEIRQERLMNLYGIVYHIIKAEECEDKKMSEMQEAYEKKLNDMRKAKNKFETLKKLDELEREFLKNLEEPESPQSSFVHFNPNVTPIISNSHNDDEHITPPKEKGILKIFNGMLGVVVEKSELDELEARKLPVKNFGAVDKWEEMNGLSEVVNTQVDNKSDPVTQTNISHESLVEVLAKMGICDKKKSPIVSPTMERLMPGRMRSCGDFSDVFGDRPSLKSSCGSEERPPSLRTSGDNEDRSISLRTSGRIVNLRTSRER